MIHDKDNQLTSELSPKAIYRKYFDLSENWDSYSLILISLVNVFGLVKNGVNDTPERKSSGTNPGGRDGSARKSLVLYSIPVISKTRII